MLLCDGAIWPLIIEPVVRRRPGVPLSNGDALPALAKRRQLTFAILVATLVVSIRHLIDWRQYHQLSAYDVRKTCLVSWRRAPAARRGYRLVARRPAANERAIMAIIAMSARRQCYGIVERHYTAKPMLMIMSRLTTCGGKRHDPAVGVGGWVRPAFRHY